MDLPHLLTAAQSTLVRSAVDSRVLAERAAAPLAAVTDLSTGRIAASSAALIGLAGVLAGVLALAPPPPVGGARPPHPPPGPGQGRQPVRGVGLAPARAATTTSGGTSDGAGPCGPPRKTAALGWASGVAAGGVAGCGRPG
ncbi:hypothetical protein, partial [Nocardia farcinica]|uniref:hypothetical protein n=1 Tax=Nocardia farcinica TaxID=37329 RepID=UPI002458184A